jgi:hypothetical protein
MWGKAVKQAIGDGVLKRKIRYEWVLEKLYY